MTRLTPEQSAALLTRIPYDPDPLGVPEDEPWPTPADFEAMSRTEFDAYIRAIGFDAQITAALAELHGRSRPRSPHRRLARADGDGLRLDVLRRDPQRLVRLSGRPGH